MNRKRKRVMDEEEIVIEDDTDEDYKDITDIKTLLESPDMLEKVMIKGIKNVLGDLSPSSKIISRNVKTFIQQSYGLISVDGDDSVKLSLMCKDYYSRSIIERIEKTITEEKPTLEKIANASLSHDERKECYKLYRIYHDANPFTEEYVKLEDKLINMLKGSGNYSAISQELDALEEELKKGTHISDTSIRDAILTLKTTQTNKTAIYRHYSTYMKMQDDNCERDKLKEWIDWALKIPFEQGKTFLEDYEDFTQFAKEASCTLDRKIYGLNKVKEELLMFYHDIHKGIAQGTNILLCGPSGVGKTLIAETSAKILKWPFYRIACGGLTDPSFVKGQSTVWVGSSPSIFVKALCHMKYKNGIILLDEIDKMDQKSQEAFLDLIDHTTNKEWRDGFLTELDIDLSGIFIIATANNIESIIPPLLDRLKVMRIPDYDIREKHEIMVNYILPSCVSYRKLLPNSIVLTQSAIDKIFSLIYKSGMREIKMVIEEIVAKIHFLMSIGKEKEDLYLSFGIKTQRLSGAQIKLSGTDIEKLW